MRKIERWLPVSLLVGLVLTAAVLFAGPPLPENDLADLAANDPQTRHAAILRLADSGQFSDLVYALGEDHTPLVKAGLAEAIQTMGIGSSNLDSIKALLTHGDATTRHLAVKLLSGHAPEVWTDLEGVADDQDETALVRAAAAAALGGAGAQARSALRDLALDADLPGVVRTSAVRALARVSPAAVDDVRKIAEDGAQDWAERTVAIRALADPASPSDTALGLLAVSKNTRVRAETAAAMAKRGKPQHLTVLAGLVTDPWPKVRYQALQAIWVLGGAPANRAKVIGRMADTDPRVLALAAKLVGQTCGDIVSTVKPSLVTLLGSGNFRVRYEAALALLALGDTSGAATMLADGASTNLSQRQMAMQAYSLISAAKK